MTTGRRNIIAQLNAHPRSRIALRTLAILLFIALFGDFIATDKPLFCVTDGKVQLPALHSAAVNMGLAKWSQGSNANWQGKDYQFVIWPLIPYAPDKLDLANSNYKGPFDSQEVRAIRFRHWLGTDKLGRDVLAGLVRGCRISLMIGCISMFLAVLIGVPIGAFAGYLGDSRWRIRWPNLVLGAVVITLAVFYLVQSAGYFRIGFVAKRGYQMFLAGIILLYMSEYFLRQMPIKTGRWVRVPADTLVMRTVEVIRSIPGLFLLLAVLGIIMKPSWIYVILLIALWRIPSMIRYVRAEAYKLREQSFIDAARVIGLTDSQIVYRHIIPNAFSPVLVSVAFGIGGAILLESSLSFLGVGMSLDTISWGKILSEARDNFGAWWLAVFPGLAIFITIAVFNILGDALTDLLEVRSKRL